MAYGKNALNASFELKGLEKYLEMAQSLGKAIDDVATEAINASLAIIEKDMIAGAERHKDKGGVLKAIKVKKSQTKRRLHLWGSWHICRRKSRSPSCCVSRVRRWPFPGIP